MILLYIDPGAGSMLIQFVLAGLLAVPFFLRSPVARTVARLRGKPWDGVNGGAEAQGPTD